jgi:hypothetical protein
MIITSILVHTDLHHSQIKPLAFVWPHVEHLPDPHLLFRGRKKGQQEDLENKQTTSIQSSQTGSDTDLTRRPSTIRYYWSMLLRFTFEGTENNMILDVRGKGVGTFFKRLLWTALQGVGLGVLVGFPVWCLAIVILGPIYKMDNMGNRWAPQVRPDWDSAQFMALADRSIALVQIIKCVYAFVLGIIINPIIALLALGSQAEHNLLIEKQAQKDEEKVTEPEAESEEVLTSPGRPALPPSTPTTRGRGRMHSNSISGSGRRMSFTANVNELPLASPSARSAFNFEAPATPITPGVDVGNRMMPPATPGSVAPRRPRAMTGASDTGSYYSLGGTGGRAQRKRRPSTASVTLQTVNQNQIGGTPSRLGMVDVNEGRSARQRTLTESTISPIRQIPQAWMSGREDSATAVENGVQLGPPAMAYRQPGVSRLIGENTLAVPRESLELRAAGSQEGDVFDAPVGLKNQV